MGARLEQAVCMGSRFAPSAPPACCPEPRSPACALIAALNLPPCPCGPPHSSPQDLPEERKPSDLAPLLPPRVQLDTPSRDYTPPAYLSLLVTDLGVLTPAAVSDELIQLYV